MTRARLWPAALSFLLLALPASPQSPPAGRSYDDLLALFRDWREFQRPRVTDGVPDYSAAAMADQARRLPEYERRLAAFDASAWPVPQQVDLRLLRAEIHGLDFDHRVLRPWARHPGFYAVLVAEQSDTPAREGPRFEGALELWRHPFPLRPESVPPLRRALRAIPRILEQARANLVGDARDLWLLGIRTQKEQGALLADLAGRLGPEHPDLAQDAARARQAVDEFRAWLEARLPEKQGRSGVGVENYDWYVKNVHLSPYSWRDEVELLQRELGRALAHLALAEQRDHGLPPLEPIATPEEWQRRLGAAVTDYVRFLRERDVVSVTDDMEPALRARIGAFPAPEGRDFFSQVEAREPLLLRCHGNHWFDLSRMERRPHASPIRRGPLLYNIWDGRAEGMATAMEEMMASAGLFADSPRSQELVYVMVAQRAARGLAALKVHGHELSLEQAIRYAHDWTPYGWLRVDGDLVWGEQGLYLEQPGYGSSYLTGKAQIEALLGERRRALGATFTLRGFFDDVNACGMIPVSMIRWELTGRDDAPLPPD